MVSMKLQDVIKHSLLWIALLPLSAMAGSEGDWEYPDNNKRTSIEASEIVDAEAVKVSTASGNKQSTEDDAFQAQTEDSPLFFDKTADNTSSSTHIKTTTKKNNDPEYALPYGEPVIVELMLNGIVRGSFPVIRKRNGDYLIRGEDLESIGVRASYDVAVTYSGDEYFSLNGLGAVQVRFDEAQLTLSAVLPAEKLPGHKINFLGKRSRRVGSSVGNSTYINYRLLNSGSDSSNDETWLLGSEIGIRYREVLFRNESSYFRYGEKEDTIRYGTSITYDNRESLQRLVIGDFAASSGNLGSAMSVGGISFSKTYSINPDFIQQPMAGFSAVVSSPSEVDIYLDDMRLRSEKVDPGEFEFGNLNYYGGRHDLKMVIRDSFGGERQITYPYYFSSLNLREGLHEYSYNVGRIRTGVGTSDDEYGAWAVSAYHRYGVTNALTMGARGDSGGGVTNVGPASVFRMNRWGVLSGSVALSRSNDGAGWAASAGYTYQQRNFHLQTYWRRYTDKYEVVGRAADSDRPEQEILAATGYVIKGFGNVGISLRHLTQYQGNDLTAASLTYSRTLNRHLRLMALATHTGIDESSDYYYLGISYQPGHSLNTLFRHQQLDDSYSDSFQIGNTTPVGEGLGYRLSAERNVTEYGQSVRLSPWAQYNGRYGIYMANVQSVSNASGDSVTGYQWGVSGGIGFIGNTMNFSRPISDSFALVDVGGVDGVRVYQGAREVGRTDEKGHLFLPDLASYQVNRIAINSSDIPIDHTINETEVYRAPSLRSGSLIRFEVTKHQAVSGRLLVKKGTVWLPVEFTELSLDGNAPGTVVPTGHGGEFYLENMEPGQYQANFIYQNNRCDFTLSIPASSEMMMDLGELKTCEFAQ